MSIQPPRAASQKTYLIYAWVGALVGLILALQLPPSLHHIFIPTPRLGVSVYLMIALCLIAGLLRRTGDEKLICGLCALLGLISTGITVSLVA